MSNQIKNSKIRIVNWLLTRKCNLKCDYCAIVRNYKDKPEQYPDMSHYAHSQMDSQYVMRVLSIFKIHNPDMFHIFYGGEPLLSFGLSNIINYCNKENIQYTIISNNAPEIQHLITDLFNKTDYIQGFTSSVDPVFDSNDFDSVKLDRVTKSIEGLRRLKEIQSQGKVKDVVAEITVMKHNIHYLYNLVKILSEEGINSDVTFIDIAKSPFYDFSNIYDENLLVSQEEAKEQMDLLLNSNFDLHMKDILIPGILKILPSNMDCEIDKNLHNITIDADGTLRLCLRIRGVNTPKLYAHEVLTSGNPQEIAKSAHELIRADKKEYCKLCNHTCHLMSKHIDENDAGSEDLIHTNKRIIQEDK
jgi:MoaA/NifB/PqqE/SkfB family radical SAM enzyme